MQVNQIKLRNPLFRNDTYKFSHFDQVPNGMEQMYSHLTPRNNKYFKRRFPTATDKAVVFGIQIYLAKFKNNWDQNFFQVPWELINEVTLELLMPHISFTQKDMVRFEDLHKLGYLPLRIKAIPEGSAVNLNIPILTVTNTIEKFHWLPNFIEPDVLNNIFKPVTVATLAVELAKLRNRYVKDTCADSQTAQFIYHAFDFRGHPEGSAEASGAAYNLITEGTDTLVGIVAAQEYMCTKSPVAYSIPALEHSTATLNIQMYRKALVIADAITEEELTDDKDVSAILAEKLDLPKKVVDAAYLPALQVRDLLMIQGKTPEQIELAVGETFTIARMLVEVYPNRTFAYVSDSYNYKRVISIILPALYDVIMAHNGKLVIRPDSGNPVEIVCGIEGADISNEVSKAISEHPLNEVFKVQGKYYKSVRRPQLRSGMYLPFFELVRNGFVQEVIVECDEEGVAINPPVTSVLAADFKGSMETLWETFGGTVNKQGFKQLDSHIGLVYGDGMTFERITSIFENLKRAGFAVDNICLAAGAYMLASATRDDLGFAIKASYAKVKGIDISLYKEPETDMSKASQKGLFQVVKDQFGEYSLKTEVTVEEEQLGELQVVFLDGQLKNITTYEEVKQRIAPLIAA